MKDDDEDKKDAMIDQSIETLRENSNALCEKMEELNSMYPTTKAFLRLCGKTHVKELAPEERVQLDAHLQAELAEALGDKKPLN